MGIQYRKAEFKLVIACLEGRWSQDRRLLDATSHYRLFKRYALVYTHA